MWNNGFNNSCNSNKCSCGCCQKKHEDKKIICKCEEVKKDNSCGCNQKQNFGFNY